MTLSLSSHLNPKKNQSKKILVPYITGGLGDNWLEVLEAVIAAGADAVEIGIPFSDPIMDGPVIQEASQKAIESGATPSSILGALAKQSFGAPLAVMTYFNIVHHAGLERFAGWLDEAKVGGVVLPDLPIEEMGDWRTVAKAHKIETVQLVAPTTPDARARMLCEEAEGFVYAVGTMGVTGVRSALSDSAPLIGSRLSSFSDKPILVGIGVSNAEQAQQAAKSSDGVIVGSALVRRLLAGEGPDGAFKFVSELRSALDELSG